jgi:hypothetical protein
VRSATPAVVAICFMVVAVIPCSTNNRSAASRISWRVCRAASARRGER